MDLGKAIDLNAANFPRDTSGSPVAYLEQVRARGDLAVVESPAGLDILIEYPISPGWQAKLGVERFVRLRHPHGGKLHAVVSPRRSQPVTPRRRSAAHEAVHGEAALLPYPEEDAVGRKLGFEGAGIMAYQTSDQMHPPMVDSEELWSLAERWPEAAREHTRAAARAVGLKSDERVLDIGCGIGGPARLLVDEFGVEVYGVANAEHMLDTARKINGQTPRWEEQIEVEFHDCQEPYRQGGFDAAWSMNMIYVVPDKEALLANAAAALAPGGRIMLEDWMFTQEADAADRKIMDLHFKGGLIATVAEIEALLDSQGFEILSEEDLGHVGRTHMERHCLAQFNSEVRPRLEADFPGKLVSGKQMADEWVEAIAAQIEMYISEKMTYRRYVAALH